MKRKICLTITYLYLLMGCVSNDLKMDLDQQPDQIEDAIKMNSIVFIDHSLNSTATRSILGFEFISENIRVSVQNSGVRPSPTGMNEVWIMLKNHSSSAIQIEGRVQFFDEYKAPSEAVSAWQRVHVPPYATVTYRELAIDRSSYYYQAELREGK